jgi:hypothetical protein
MVARDGCSDLLPFLLKEHYVPKISSYLYPPLLHPPPCLPSADFSRWAIGIPLHPNQERGLFDLQKSKIPLPQSSVDYLYNEEAPVPNLGFDGRLFVPLKQTTLPPSSCHLGLKTSPFVEGCFHLTKV